MRAHNFKDLTGQRFNRRIVLKFVGIKTFSSPRAKQSVWLTRCDCGTEAEVTAGSLRGGKSCGCLSREISGVSRRLPNGGAARNANLLKYKASAKKRNLEWSLSEEQFDLLTSGNCHYCGTEPKQICRASISCRQTSQIIYNGIDRVNNTLGYISENTVSCCKVCNRAKDVMSQDEFLSWASRVTRHNETRPSIRFVDK
jgi:hypothetical protein